MDLLKWIESQNPDTVPYRPDASHTGGFGLREHSIGSPAHLGNDRGSEPPHIKMPFHEGQAEWKMLGEDNAWGSFLRMYPTDSTPVEIHVAHTLPTDTPHASSWSGIYSRGATLPACAADIGLSTGAHTHTELIIAYDDDALSQLREHSSVEIIHDTAINIEYLTRHCMQYELDFDVIREKLARQIEVWGIREMTDVYAVRDAEWLDYIQYRTPHWGRTDTVHIDPYWALMI